MDYTLQSKACVACARAKRKCGKQIPTCGRCSSRGITCDYPSAKAFYLPPRQPEQMPSPLALQQERPSPRAATPHIATTPTITDMLFEIPGDSMAIDDLYPFQFDGAVALPTPSSSHNIYPKSVSLPWYLDEFSWEIDHITDAESPPIYSTTLLLDHVDIIKNWQSRWIRIGSNPYIHPNMYRFHIPRCVQDAYTTLSTYVGRTPENKVMVSRIIEDRVRQLLSDQPGGTEGDETALNTLEHLARVHALHIYQTIGLYDGDIRLRHVAETQVPTMNCWLRQLMQSAKATAAQGLQSFVRPVLVAPSLKKMPSVAANSHPNSLGTPPSPHMSLGVPMSTNNNQYSNDDAILTPQLSQEESEWYAWSFSETIRRTWMVVTALQTIYLTLQVRNAPCPGGAMFTVREGLWDAKSAFAWKSRCDANTNKSRAVELDFVNRTQWSGMFESRRPEEIDEFCKEALEITYGSERVERWKINMAANCQRG